MKNVIVSLIVNDLKLPILYRLESVSVSNRLIMSWYQVNICSLDKIMQWSRNWSNEDIFEGKYTTWTVLFSENTDSGRLGAFFFLLLNVTWNFNFILQLPFGASGRKLWWKHPINIVVVTLSFWLCCQVVSEHKASSFCSYDWLYHDITTWDHK